MSPNMVDPAVFEHLQVKIDEDSQLRQEIRNVVQVLERQGRHTMSILSRAHSIAQADRAVHIHQISKAATKAFVVGDTLHDAWSSIRDQIETVSKLRVVSLGHPYYRYNGMWSRELQITVC